MAVQAYLLSLCVVYTFVLVTQTAIVNSEEKRDFGSYGKDAFHGGFNTNSGLIDWRKLVDKKFIKRGLGSDDDGFGQSAYPFGYNNGYQNWAAFFNRGARSLPFGDHGGPTLGQNSFYRGGLQDWSRGFQDNIKRGLGQPMPSRFGGDTFGNGRMQDWRSLFRDNGRKRRSVQSLAFGNNGETSLGQNSFDKEGFQDWSKSFQNDIKRGLGRQTNSRFGSNTFGNGRMQDWRLFFGDNGRKRGSPDFPSE